MVEFALPQNSKIVEGKTFKKKNSSSNTKLIEIYRWERDSNEKPRIDKFYIECAYWVRCFPWFLRLWQPYFPYTGSGLCSLVCLHVFLSPNCFHSA